MWMKKAWMMMNWYKKASVTVAKQSYAEVFTRAATGQDFHSAMVIS